jgi:tetratricopeptide (TPR) repeat protein
MLAMNKNYVAALKVYTEVINKDSTYSPAYFNMGNCYLELKEYSQAEGSYNKALQLSPDDPEIFKNLGYLNLKEENYDNALKYFKKALDLDPKSDTAYKGMGDAYSKSGLYDEAINAYKKCLDINPTDYGTMSELGKIYYNNKDYQNAAITLDKASKLKDDPDTDLQLAESYIKLSKNDDAKSVLQGIKSKFPGYKNISTVDNYLSQL